MADPHLQIKGGGGSHPNSEIREGDRSQKQFFSALRASFWSKNKGGGAGPPAPFPGSATDLFKRL